MIGQAFVDVVAGKRMALIGGAPGADEDGAAEAEIVARCNLYIGAGQRCDMAFLAGNAPADPPAELKWICLNLQSPKSVGALQHWDVSQRKVFGFVNACYRGASPHGPTQEWLNMFWHQLGGMPLCGILAARALTLCPIKTLYITGFDFYINAEHEAGPDTKGRMTWMRGPHDLASQLKWLLSLEQFDDRVALDPRIHEVAETARSRGFLG